LKLNKEQMYIYCERFAIMMEDPEMDEKDARARALKEALDSSE